VPLGSYGEIRASVDVTSPSHFLTGEYDLAGLLHFHSGSLQLLSDVIRNVWCFCKQGFSRQTLCGGSSDVQLNVLEGLRGLLMRMLPSGKLMFTWMLEWARTSSPPLPFWGLR
jgi:hypothetical protein